MNYPFRRKLLSLYPISKLLFGRTVSICSKDNLALTALGLF